MLLVPRTTWWLLCEADWKGGLQEEAGSALTWRLLGARGERGEQPPWQESGGSGSAVDWALRQAPGALFGILLSAPLFLAFPATSVNWSCVIIL